MTSALGSAVLDAVLGEYIEGFNQRQLELDVLNGHLLLQNLTVRSSALQRLQLPLAVKSGVIGRVELRIPWANLSSGTPQPTQLRLDNVLLLVGPQSEVPWDAAAEEKRELERRQSVLIKHEEKLIATADAKRRKKEGFVAALCAKVIDNLKVRPLQCEGRWSCCHSLHTIFALYTYALRSTLLHLTRWTSTTWSFATSTPRTALASTP